MDSTEVIEIKKFSKGTKVINFFGVDHPDFSDFPIGYLILDAAKNPVRIVENKFDIFYKRLPNNNFVYNGSAQQITGNTSSEKSQTFNRELNRSQGLSESVSFDDSIKYVTGRTSTQNFNYEINEDQKGILRQKFIKTNQDSYGKENIYWTEFQNASVDDLYANVSFVRTYNTLNTLSIVNSVEGETTFRESTTGVLFGKLESLQKINDENGNKIRIPLANVPVAIFKPTEEFPDISSVDSNGNRIVLNLKENSSEGQYFNNETFQFDESFLTSTESVKTVVDKYKYTALTNEKGEFVIYDVPIGVQTFMLEVDLLKQGLTKDEVALNFFPYPTTENSNIDSIPHFYFRQFSVNIVPSWGDFQSGYTQLNISIPLDLRKWSTYIFPPVGFAENEKLEVTVAKNANRKFKIQIRDMTVKDFPLKAVTLAKVDNALDRDVGSQYVWYNEFAENRRQVEYTEFGCYVLKLPANLYDPEGNRTDENGVPTYNKGVWLSCYQFKEFIDDNISSRATGGHSYWSQNTGFQFISHFDLNYVPGNDIDRPLKSDVVAGKFPYEKPWSLTYPKKYSIPSKPTKQRFVYGSQRVGSPGNYYMEEPPYSDGDLLGIEANPSENLPGGFGLQSIPDPSGYGGVMFPNMISQVATKNFMYKYEANISWNETYSNGFEPSWNTPSATQPFAGLSKVVNGETYQRVECGYGYFMLPQGWPRYVRAPWGGDAPSVDIQNGSSAISVPKVVPAGFVGEMYSPKKWFVDVYNINQQNLVLALSNQASIKRGTISIYRIVKSGLGINPPETSNIIFPKTFIIPTYAKLKCNLANLAFSFSLKNIGEVMVKYRNNFNGNVFYYDKDDNIKLVKINETIDFYPGKIIFINGEGENSSQYVSSILTGAVMLLPGNASFNTDINQYTAAVYNFRVTYTNTNAGDPGSKEFDISVGANTSIPTYWVRTETSGGDHGVVHQGVSRSFYYGSSSYNGEKNNVTKMFYEEYGGDLMPYDIGGGSTTGYGYYISA